MAYYSGKINKICIFELKDSQKTGFYADKTHTISLDLENGPGNLVAVSTVQKKPEYDLVWQRKINDVWTTILDGAELEFMYTEKGGYWNVNKETINIIKNGTTEPKSYSYHKAKGANTTDNSGGSTQSYEKKDWSGVDVRHSILAAGNTNGYKKLDIVGLLEASKNMHDLTKELKATYKNMNNGLSDYDIGADVANAVIHASKIGGSMNIIKANALEILNNVSFPMYAYVKGEGVAPKKEVMPQNVTDDPDIPF